MPDEKFINTPAEEEAEKASNSYLMSLIAFIGGTSITNYQSYCHSDLLRR